jgi:hypothetical protein
MDSETSVETVNNSDKSINSINDKIKDIEKAILDLQLQHNAMVRNTVKADSILGSLPGYRTLDAGFRKFYNNYYTDHPENYDVQFFQIPGDRSTLNPTIRKNSGGGKTS